MKYTPGPWRIAAPICEDDKLRIEDSDGRRLAIIAGVYPMGPKTEDANARLIAAAPELVIALKMCAAVLSGEAMSKSTLVYALESARDVLKKVGEETQWNQ